MRDDRGQFLRGTRNSLSTEFCVGQIPWNKGLTKNNNMILRRLAESPAIKEKKKSWHKHKLDCPCCVCRAHRKETMGSANSFYGKHHSKNTREKLRGLPSSFRAHPPGCQCNAHLAMRGELSGNKNYFYGKHFTGSQSPHWRGGVSFIIYPREFKLIKKIIRQRDQYHCKLCGDPENGQKLSVHHIDYNPKNNVPNNLICLCRLCHGKTAHSRNGWSFLFDSLMELRTLEGLVE